MMKTLYLYTNDEKKIEKLETHPHLAEYEIKTFVVDENYELLHHQGLSLVVIYGAQHKEALWAMIDREEARMAKTVFLFVLEKEDFSFAYKACRYGFVQLLLASEGEEAFYKGVMKCIEKLLYIERVETERSRLAEYEFQKTSSLMERLLTNILNKPAEVEFLLPEINKRYGTKLGEGDYQVIIITVNRYELYGKSSQFVKDAVLTTLRELSHAKDIIMGYRENYGLMGILHYSEEVNVSERKTAYEHLRDQLMLLTNRYENCLLTLSVGKMVKGISRISDSFMDASLAKEFGIVEGKSFVYAQEVTNLRQDMEKYLPERKRKELIRYIALGDVRHVNSWFLEFHQNMKHKFMQYPPAFALFCQQIYKGISESEKTVKSRFFPEWKFFYLQFIFDVEERIRQLEMLLLEICHVMAQSMEEEQDVAVQAIAYMKVHYKEPINLDYIAQKCGLSTSYFSRKFKEQTGVNYIDVLTDIRIREAQKLLGTTDMSIGSIIEEVGYCDDKHFRKLFNKVTGMKPTEYRKKLRTEKSFD